MNIKEKERSSKKRIPVLIDTDPGIDDTLAILLLEASNQVDLKGITVVAGNMPVEVCVENALYLKRLFHLNAKVAKGFTTPDKTLANYHSSSFHGERGLGSTIAFGETNASYSELQEKLEEGDAAALIYQEALAAKGELVICAIGPLTNISTAVLQYPDLPKLVSRLVIMGGTTGKGNVSEFAEFNAWFDPEAYQVVLSAGFTIDLIGLNATDQCPIERDEFLQLKERCAPSEGGKFLAELLDFMCKGAYERGKKTNIIYDAIAVGSLLDDELCEFTPYILTCEANLDAKNRGQIFIHGTTTDATRPCRVAVKGNQQRFYDLLFYFVQKVK